MENSSNRRYKTHGRKKTKTQNRQDSSDPTVTPLCLHSFRLHSASNFSTKITYMKMSCLVWFSQDAILTTLSGCKCVLRNSVILDYIISISFNHLLSIKSAASQQCANSPSATVV